MHAFFLGVAKQFISMWTSRKNENYFINESTIEALDTAMLQTQLPSEFTRSQLQLRNIANWKYYDFYLWTSYFSVPILESVLPQEYFEHWSEFVDIMSIACSTRITFGELSDLDSRCKVFQQRTAQLYKVYYKISRFYIQYFQLELNSRMRMLKSTCTSLGI